MQISALVTMYTHEEDIDSAIDVFTQAIQYYQSKQVRLSICFHTHSAIKNFTLSTNSGLEK